jgi:hypothetical protein
MELEGVVAVAFKTKSLEGRPHYVVSVVMALANSVMAGSHGPLLYPENALRKSVAAWNGRPVVVYHPPIEAGGYAGTPATHERQRIGTLFNARMSGGKLMADAWIDKEKAREIDPRVIQSILANQVMEVSTGMFTDVDPKPGYQNGRKYEGRVQSIMPDHLAVLPDIEGACSCSAGCGLCRNHGTEGELLALPSTA